MYRDGATSDDTPRRLLARRWFMQECGIGLGTMALAELLGHWPARDLAATTRSIRWRQSRTSPAKPRA